MCYNDYAMKYTIQEIAAFINSLPAEISELLTQENQDKLEKFRVRDLRLNVYQYEFPNGYGCEFFSPHPTEGWTVRLYPLSDEENTLQEASGLCQTECFIEAQQALRLPKYNEPSHSERIIADIYAKCLNADDLAKIASAIEAMRETLIEISAARFERATHA